MTRSMISFAGAAWLVGSVLGGCSRGDALAGGEGTAAATSSASASAGAGASATASTAAAAPVPSNVPDAVEGAEITMASSTVDGLEVQDVSCRGGGGLLGGPIIVGVLAKQRKALDACVGSKAASVRIHFVFQAGKTGDLRVKGAPDDKAARCVAELVKAQSFPDTGACAMTLSLGGA